MFASAPLALAALLATTPPIFEVEKIFDDSWDKAADAFRACSAKAAAANRAGTVWVDIRYPEFNIESGYRSPTWTLRRSPGLRPADEACVRAVVARKVLPGMGDIAVHSHGKTHTKELVPSARRRFRGGYHSAKLRDNRMGLRWLPPNPAEHDPATERCSPGETCNDVSLRITRFRGTNRRKRIHVGGSGG